MAKSLAMIGIDASELPWLRMFLFLLRHPDPTVSEMARQTIVYIAKNAQERSGQGDASLNHTG